MPAPDVSAREAEVLDALGERLANSEIAARLCVSVRTVESHVSALLRKTGAANRRELAEMARQRQDASQRQVLRRLPMMHTLFVGRSDEVATTRQALHESRLVTLVGAAGVGKTRLAVKVADLCEPATAVAFVDLTAATDAATTVVTLRRALDIGDDPDQDTAAALASRFGDRPALFVIDNCEQVIDAAGLMVTDLLARVGALRLLVTSREPLSLPGEYVVNLAPLPVPDADASAAALRHNPSVQLFADRAASVDSGFSLDDQTAGYVASVCRRLDGIPLALELAAAQVPALAAKQIDERLADRFGLLRAPARGRPARHATLEAAVSWSYDLLEVAERALLDRLAVFRGTFSLEAAQEVATGAPVLADDVVRLLVRLVSKSLVVAQAVGEEKRYRLLETIRAFGWQRLVDAGELPTWRDRHRAWMFARMQEAATGLSCDVVPEWLTYLDTDLDNMEAAIDWSVRTPEGAAQALPVIRALERYWMARGVRRAQGVRWSITAAERASGVNPAARVEALLGAILLLIWSDLGAAHALMDQANRLAMDSGDTTAEGYAALGESWVRMFAGQFADARTLGTRAARSIDRADPLHPWALVAAETAAANCGPGDGGRVREAAILVLDYQDRHMHGAWLSWSADIDVAAGQEDRARASIAESLSEARAAGCPSCESQALASSALLPGAATERLATARDAARLANEIAEPWGVLCALEVVVDALAASGAFDDAALIAGATAAARERTGWVSVLPGRRAALTRGAEAARTALSADEYAALRQEGAAMDYTAAVSHVLR